MKREHHLYEFLLLGLFVTLVSNAEPSLTLRNTIRDRVYRPTRVAVQNTGTLAVSDFLRKQIYIFDRNGRSLSSLSVPDAPISIAYGADGNLYVGVANDVLRMTAQGAIVDRFSLHGTAPQSPVGIAVAASGNVYVVDKEMQRISVFSSGGDLQFSFGSNGSGNGQFRMPSGLTIDPLSNEVIVADAGNSRVQIFSLQGQFLRAFGRHVEQVDSIWRIVGRFAQIQGVAVDAEHRIYVTDSGLNHVQIFTSSGSHLGFLGREGHPSAYFRVPTGVVVCDSSLFVTCMAGSEIHAYTIGGLISSVSPESVPLTFALEQNYPNPFNPSTTLKFSIPSDGTVTLTIYDIVGREVAIVVNEHHRAGTYSIVWNGRNSVGTPVSSGIYFYRLQVDDKFTQTNKMVFLK